MVDDEKLSDETGTKHYQEIPFVVEEGPVVHTGQSAPEPRPVETTPPEAIAQPEIIPENITADTIGKTPPSSKHEGSGRGRFIIVALGVIIFLVIFGAILRLVFFSGGGREGVADKNIVLKYWGLWEDEQVFEPLIAEYERKNPGVQIVYTKMSPQNYRQKIINRDQSVSDRPDIFRYHSTWLPTLDGVATPIPESVMSDSEFEKLFYPVVVNDLQIGDDYYGIPLGIDGLVLLYNDKLFKAAGIERPPTTWEDIIDSATRMTVKDQSDKVITSGIALGTASNIEHFSDILGWMILQNGGDLKNLSAPEAFGALQQYRSFAEPPFNLWDETLPNSVVAFTEEQVAMIFAPSWQILTIKQANPDLALKVAPLPVVPGGNRVALSNYWVEGVSRLSEHQEEGWKFLRYLVEQENMTNLYELQAKTRLFGEPYSRIDLAQTLVQNEYIGAVVSQANDMKTLPVVARTYDDGINDEIIKYLEDAINATIEGVAYSEAFSRAGQGVGQVLEKYNIQ